MQKIKSPIFGQWIRCTAYIKPSGNAYVLHNDRSEVVEFLDLPMCVYRENGATDGVEVEDFHECERFRTVKRDFDGIFVGTTVLNTKITAERHDHPYSGSYFMTETKCPEKFAVVYYANNKKRLVPLAEIQALGRGEA